MKNRGGFGTQPHPVHQRLGIGRPALDHGRAIGGAPEDRMTGFDPRSGEHNSAGVIGPYGQFAGGNLVSPPAELELHHELDS